MAEIFIREEQMRLKALTNRLLVNPQILQTHGENFTHKIKKLQEALLTGTPKGSNKYPFNI